jgi:hypothetical protein
MVGSPVKFTMSEYQYYEFRAIDRPLGQGQMNELRALSTRAEITPVSFRNVYNYGSFKGDPRGLMERYFDAFVYVANWGTHELMLRIPRRFIDVDAASAYFDGEVLSLTAGKEHVVTEFSVNFEPDAWVEGEHWMASLVGLRDELMHGDFRALYIGWLASLPRHVGSGNDDFDGEDSDAEDRFDGEDLDADPDDDSGAGDDEDRLEPPVPPGLAKLSTSLLTLVEFLQVEDELIEVAAASSSARVDAEPTPDELERWIESIPVGDKDDLLLRLLDGESVHLLRSELQMRFRDSRNAGKPRAPEVERRTAAQLVAARNALVAEKERKASERKRAEKETREHEEAVARSRALDALAGREAEAWREVNDLIATKRPDDYDRAVSLLLDLKDLAIRSGRKADALARIRDLRERHRNKPSLIKRFNDRNLGP